MAKITGIGRKDIDDGNGVKLFYHCIFNPWDQKDYIEEFIVHELLSEKALHRYLEYDLDISLIELNNSGTELLLQLKYTMGVVLPINFEDYM